MDLMSGQDSQPTMGDAFGAALLGHLDDGDPLHVMERDDGLVEAMATAVYFGGPDAWSAHEAGMLGSVGDAVLDIGAGAGRVTLALRERGKQATALDVSEGAIEVCRRRGIEDVHLGDVGSVGPGPRFDTFILFGNNLALLGSREEAPRFLAALRRVARPGARILGTTCDPYRTENPEHLGYHERNRARGRMPGQIGLRTRYRALTTPWHDILFVSIDELRELAGPEGWRLSEVLDDGGPVYGAALEME
jgi:SAM-dependent methyltransferase